MEREPLRLSHGLRIRDYNHESQYSASAGSMKIDPSDPVLEFVVKGSDFGILIYGIPVTTLLLQSNPVLKDRALRHYYLAFANNGTLG